MRKTPLGPSEYDSDLQTVRAIVSEEFLQNISTSGERPFLIILSGLPGTGKSYFARQLNARIPSVVIGSDRTRKALITNPTYSKKEHSRVFAVCHKIVEDLLLEGYVTIFEATNLTAKSRLPLIKITEKLQVPSLCLVFTASENIIKNRLTARSSGVDEASYSDADWDIYSKLKPSQEPPDQNHWYVDSTKNISIALNKLVKIIRSHPQNPNIY